MKTVLITHLERGFLVSVTTTAGPPPPSNGFAPAPAMPMAPAIVPGNKQYAFSEAKEVLGFLASELD